MDEPRLSPFWTHCSQPRHHLGAWPVQEEKILGSNPRDAGQAWNGCGIVPSELVELPARKEYGNEKAEEKAEDVGPKIAEHAEWTGDNYGPLRRSALI